LLPSLALMVPVYSSNLSLRVLFPWSMWATMQKLRYRSMGMASMRFSSSDGVGFALSFGVAYCLTCVDDGVFVLRGLENLDIGHRGVEAVAGRDQETLGIPPTPRMLPTLQRRPGRQYRHGRMKPSRLFAPRIQLAV
jgi:hypothetical protein